MTAIAHHGITIQSVPVDDQPHVGFSFRASCLCGWHSQPEPRVDAVKAGRCHVEDRPTPATGPTTCEPWCSDGDGHPDELFVEDQRCDSSVMNVELSLPDDPLTVSPHESMPDFAMVYASKRPAESLRIHVNHNDEPDVLYTPAEAQQLIEALQLLLVQVA